MNWNLVYACLTLLSCLASAGLSAYLANDWRNRQARHLIYLMMGTGIWAGAYTMELLSPDLGQKLMWVRLQYLGAGSVGLLFFRFILVSVERPGRLSWGMSPWLWTIPAVVIFSAFTNHWHGLIAKDAWLVIKPGIQAVQYHRGPVFWFHTLTSYLLIGAALILLIYKWLSSRGIRRKQVTVLILGIFAPLGANGIYLTGLPGLSYIDLSPTAFMVSSAVFTVGLFRYHLIHLIPLAHEAVMDGLGDPVVVMDQDDRVAEVNRSCVRAMGLAGRPRVRGHAGTLFPDLYGLICRYRENKPREFTAALDLDGKGPRTWHLRVSPLWGRQKSRSGWLVLLRDITDQKAAETALRNARNYVRDVINAMPSVIVGVNRDGTVVHWNRGAWDMTGVSEERAAGLPLVSLFPQLARFWQDVETAMETQNVLHREKEILESDGGNIIADILIFPVTSGKASGAVIRVDDITEQTKIRDMMVQSEKMMSIGGLAAGMAHEINNPLSGMIQNIQVIRNRLSRPVPANLEAAKRHGIDLEHLHGYMVDRKLFHMMDQVVDVGIRAGKIVENMLSFSRKQEGDKSVHSLPEVVDATLSLLENDFNLGNHYDFRAVAVERVFEHDLPLVPCERSQIQQVLFNILKNGAQAMAQSKTRVPCFRIRYFVQDGMAGVEIRDNGPGIPEAVQKRIFEPFFTTKSVGRGTGLGLSVSYYIVRENHNGELSVMSEPGQGTAFVVKLPLSV